MLVGVALPGVLGFTQSVEEQRQLWSRVGIGGFQRVSSDPDIAAVGTRSHVDRQGAISVAQPVAESGIERGDGQIRLILRRGGTSGGLRRHSTSQPASGPDRSPDASVRRPSNAVVSSPDRGTAGQRSGCTKEAGPMVGRFDARHHSCHGPSSGLAESLSLLWCHRQHPPGSDAW